MTTNDLGMVSRASVDRMLKDWQAECLPHPAIYNQANVLRDRLKELEPANADIERLFSELADSPLGMESQWVVNASSGVPSLSGGRRGTLARGTIGTWKEFELIAALVNGLIASRQISA